MLISLIKYNQPKSHQISYEIPPSVYKIKGQVSNFGYFGFLSWLLILVMFVSLTVV